MAPAFASPKQAAAFGVLLLTIILLPLLLGEKALPRRAEVYKGLPGRSGPHEWCYRQIFEEKGDIDIAFVGSSHIMTDLDTPYIRNELSKALGRPACVVTLSWTWAGFDALYFFTRDLLQHRKVRMLVAYDEFDGRYIPHWTNLRFYRFCDSEPVLAGLPLRQRLPFYSSAILGTPLNLLYMTRPNIVGGGTFVADFTGQYQCPDPAERLGSMRVDLGYNDAPFGGSFAPATGATPADAVVFSPETAAQFDFPKAQMPAEPSHFAKKWCALGREKGAKLVLLGLPITEEWDSKAVRIHWPAPLRSQATMVGIPPATLFHGLTRQEVLRLFYDPGHLNSNGQKLYTPLICPSLVKIYEQPL